MRRDIAALSEADRGVWRRGGVKDSRDHHRSDQHCTTRAGRWSEVSILLRLLLVGMSLRRSYRGVLPAEICEFLLESQSARLHKSGGRGGGGVPC